jgi:ATP-dependent Clp protease adapter protein ClpS
MSVDLLPDVREQDPGLGDGDFVVVVFDNDHNTFEEVTHILMQATRCTSQEAEIETWEVHNLGKSVVHHGSEAECERAATVIRTIGIAVEVREE